MNKAMQNVGSKDYGRGPPPALKNDGSLSINLNEAPLVEYVDGQGEMKPRARTSNLTRTSPKRNRKLTLGYNPSKGKVSQFFD